MRMAVRGSRLRQPCYTVSLITVVFYFPVSVATTRVCKLTLTLDGGHHIYILLRGLREVCRESDR
jgi:hypothetical protein